MIFVTVGTHDQGFERLVKKMDELAGQIDEEVVIQIGNTNYKPKNVKWFRFVTSEEVIKYYKRAEIVISHGGAGSILDAISEKKILIIVPRLKKYNEVIDDQQLELSKALSNLGKASTVYEVNNLKKTLKMLPRTNNFKNNKNDPNLVKYLSKIFKNNKD